MDFGANRLNPASCAMRECWIPEDRPFRISVWVAFGLLLHLLEGAFLPRAFPFRLGLANLIALLALRLDGFAAAIEVSLWRTLLASVLYGTFLQMTFFMSLAGAVAGVLGMALASWLGGRFLSEMGISLVGAMCSVAGQLSFASKVLGSELIFLLPLFLFLGLIGGTLNGLLAGFILEGKRT